MEGFNIKEAYVLRTLFCCLTGFAQAQTWFTVLNNKTPLCGASFALAVREGFEPSVPFPVRQFSKLFLSATQAPHRFAPANVLQKNEFEKLEWQKKKIFQRVVNPFAA